MKLFGLTVTGFIKTRINFVEGEICCSKANVKVNRGNKGAVGRKLAGDPTFTQKSPPPPPACWGDSHRWARYSTTHTTFKWFILQYSDAFIYTGFLLSFQV